MPYRNWTQRLDLCNQQPLHSPRDFRYQPKMLTNRFLIVSNPVFNPSLQYLASWTGSHSQRTLQSERHKQEKCLITVSRLPVRKPYLWRWPISWEKLCFFKDLGQKSVWRHSVNRVVSKQETTPRWLGQELEVVCWCRWQYKFNLSLGR